MAGRGGVAAPADAPPAVSPSGVKVHAAVLGAGLLVLGLAWAFASAEGVDGDVLSREPQVTLDGELYVGALSNLGALVWMVGVVFAFVGWCTSSEPRERQMFLVGALLGLVLLVDDFFLVHDWLHQHSGLLEKGLILGYLGGVVLLAAAYRDRLGPLAVAGILATLGFLALSVVLDLRFNGLDQLVEDGMKFLGICTWATTWVLRAHPWTLRPPAGA